jgi:peptidyl-prolyl cis-trans isomerase D
MPDSTAKVLADSILAAVKSGADFTALVTKYSSDEGSKTKGGEIGPFTYETMVPEFSEFSFNQPVGSKGVVKTVYGYHVIDILRQNQKKPAYKIAFLAKEIVPGDATINAASLQATKASAEKDAKRLSAFAAKNGYGVTQVPALVKENDFSVGNLQDARALVRWAFEAKPGSVSEVFSIGDQFIVATVDKVFKEGVQDAATARQGSEVIIRNEKKAVLILNKLGSNPALENAAATYKKQVMQAGGDSSLTLASQVVSGIGVEPRVIGAAFNKDYTKQPSPPFAGNSGVFLVKVLSIQRKPEDSPEVASQRSISAATGCKALAASM